MHGKYKEEKMGIKKKKTFTQIVAVGRFLICQKCLITANAMCLRIKVAQLNSLSAGKEITGILGRPTGILQQLEVFYILF